MQPIANTRERGFPELFNAKRMEAMLAEKDTKEVRVFNLKKGMTLNVGGKDYKVVTCRDDGKIVLKAKKNA